MSLLSNKPRNATIICKEDCHFAILTKEHYRSVLGYLRFLLL